MQYKTLVPQFVECKWDNICRVDKRIRDNICKILGFIGCQKMVAGINVLFLC